MVILNYNCAVMTRDCVESIAETKHERLKVIVVDNASTDNSRAVLEEAAGELGFEFIASHRNGGFSEGSNIGMVRALGTGARWIHLLNPDTKVAPDFYY